MRFVFVICVAANLRIAAHVTALDNVHQYTTNTETDYVWFIFHQDLHFKRPLIIIIFFCAKPALPMFSNNKIK